MKYTTIMLSLGLTAVAIVALGVGSASAQPTLGNSSVLLSSATGGSPFGSGPFMLVAGHGHGGGGHGMGFRGFRGGHFYGGYPDYWGSYPLEYNTSPSQTCVFNGYSYTCYNFPSSSEY
jgi:hypothetical protein